MESEQKLRSKLVAAIVLATCVLIVFLIITAALMLSKGDGAESLPDDAASTSSSGQEADHATVGSPPEVGADADTETTGGYDGEQSAPPRLADEAASYDGVGTADVPLNVFRIDNQHVTVDFPRAWGCAASETSTDIEGVQLPSIQVNCPRNDTPEPDGGGGVFIFYSSDQQALLNRRIDEGAEYLGATSQGYHVTLDMQAGAGLRLPKLTWTVK